MDFLEQPTRNLFFTGKGGVGKTSMACAAAVQLANRGRRVLLVSTDPASNLDDVLGVRLGNSASPVEVAVNLLAMNIDPQAAAHEYRERMVGPYRGVLPEAAIKSMEEQFSGSCTLEIAAFDEFSRLLGHREATSGFDHVIFDTAPTGHTILLLDSALAYHREAKRQANQSSESIENLLPRLRDPDYTRVLVVTLPESTPVHEAEKLQEDLRRAGIEPYAWVVNQALSPLSVSDQLVERVGS